MEPLETLKLLFAITGRAGKAMRGQWNSRREDYKESICKSLYDLGARKVAVVGLVQSGCSPNALATYGTNGSSCVEMINNAVQIFNRKLIPLVTKLNANLPGAKFTCINFYQIDSESTQAFRYTGVACCCSLSSTGLCDPSTIPCPDRTQYAYYDSAVPRGLV